MDNTPKTMAFLVLIVLAGFFLINILSGRSDESSNFKAYEHKLRPIQFAAKEFQELEPDRNDPAMKLARLWELPAIHNKYYESCLETFADQHPNNLVRKQKATSLYDIEIGSSYWYVLASAYEKYATDACYSFSGFEAEKVYADKLRENLTDEELQELLEYFDTDIGRKYVVASNHASERVREMGQQKQRKANNTAVETYYNKIDELQERP